MQLPSWLSALTGANKFANNPANGFQANLGDMFQGAAHSMAQHYRGKGGTYGGPGLIEGMNAGPGLSTPIPAGAPEVGSTLGALFGGITGQELPSAANAAVTSGMETLPPPPAPPQTMPPQMSPAEMQAITARLNAQPDQMPWGQMPLSALLGTGLRPF